MNEIKLDKGWNKLLGSELAKPYMKELFDFLDQEKAKGKVIYPEPADIFAALNLTPFDQVKVVILGQDPYHGPHQAHGLSFSVRSGVKIPPSLVNIFKELKGDLNIDSPSNGNLSKWAEQGVLLLNNVLTVEATKPGSHHQKGWEDFTNRIIEILNEKKDHLVFILWGSPAQKKAAKVEKNKHFVIQSVHPSPLSSYRGFFGSRPFSQTNDYLKTKNIAPIDWSL